MPKDRWTEKQYSAEAFNRARSIVQSIVAGNYPYGIVNLLSQLPTSVSYPDMATARRVQASIWRQIEELRPQLPKLAEYNLELRVEERGKYATILLVYSPDDVRKLSKGETSENE